MHDWLGRADEHMYIYIHVRWQQSRRLPKFLGLFCERALFSYSPFAKETWWCSHVFTKPIIGDPSTILVLWCVCEHVYVHTYQYTKGVLVILKNSLNYYLNHYRSLNPAFMYGVSTMKCICIHTSVKMIYWRYDPPFKVSWIVYSYTQFVQFMNVSELHMIRSMFEWFSIPHDVWNSWMLKCLRHSWIVWDYMLFVESPNSVQGSEDP